MAVGEELAVTAQPALRKAPSMAHARSGYHQYPPPVQVDPAADIQILTVVRHGAIEAAEPVEDLGADQHAGAGDGEHLGHRVVLALVVLAGGDERHRHTHPVRRQADALQEAGVVPLHELGTHHRGSVSHRLVHQASHHVRSQNHVVVTDQQECRGVRAGRLVIGDRLGARRRSGHRDRTRGWFVDLFDLPVSPEDQAGGRVDGRAETGVAGYRHDGRVRDHRGDLVDHVSGRAAGPVAATRDVHHRHRQRGVVLIPQRSETLDEPLPRLVSHDDGANSRSDPAEALRRHSGALRGFH